MGRGDKKTKKGKIFSGSFGKLRPAKSAKKVAAKKVVVAKKAEPAPAATSKKKAN